MCNSNDLINDNNVSNDVSTADCTADVRYVEHIMFNYINGGLFKSAGNWIHPKRKIESNELIFVTEGTVYIEEAGVEYILRKNDVLFLEKGKFHGGFKESTDVKFYWVHFKCGLDFKTKTVDGKRLAILFKQLLHYEYTSSYPREACELCFKLIKIELESETEMKSGKLCGEVREWIRLNCNRVMDVKTVAGHFNYNSDYLCRIFKANYGVNLKEYINIQRCEYIKMLLLSPEISLEEAAEQTGFESYHAFLKYFKYHEGITPTKYKNAYFNIHMNNK